MRAILFVLALALSACASQPELTARATGSGQITGFATAAMWGTWEAELAPAYTRIAALRYRAARAFQAGRITRDTAIAVQAGGDRANALLDASRRGNRAEPTAQQRADLAAALGEIDQIESLLE